jgi:SpoVK/Ycf46/Vps4 family AAA+-type ATPase
MHAMTRGNSLTLAALQKTYDDIHLVCSTAIYFESQSNEPEALRCWKNARDQINYHRLYRVPSNYRPKSEREKALVGSLRQLELQTKERIELLEALKESRKDALESDSAQPPTPGIGDGTIPPLSIPDLAAPPKLPARPLPPRTFSTDTYTQPTPPPPPPSRPPISPSGATRSSSRTPSPEKSGKFRKTLRGEAPARNPKKERPTRAPLATGAGAGVGRDGVAGAAKAATQAWGHGGSYRLSPTNSGNGGRDAAMMSAKMTMGARNGKAREGDRDLWADFDGNWESEDAARQSKRRPEPDAGRYSDNGSMTRPRRGKDRATNAVASNPGPPPRIKRSELPELRTTSSLESAPRSTPSRTNRSNLAVRRKPLTSSPSSNQPAPIKPNPRHPLPKPPVDPVQSMSSADESSPSDNEDEEEEEEPPPSPSTTFRVFSHRVMSSLPRGIDPAAATQILNDILITGDEVHWTDIAGLNAAKNALKENVVYPFLRPDLFLGLREPARGMLLFGPPGTGKTMLARAVATESKSTFFAISASSLVSKFLGESEKLVRALFALAKMLAPSIIFVDEIDSLLSSRDSSGEHEASRRIKTEFLIQWSDLARAAAGRESETGDASRVLVLAATNAPWAIDEAARRRFVRRQYIPLPEAPVRKEQIGTLLKFQKQGLTDEEVDKLVILTEGMASSF